MSSELHGSNNKATMSIYHCFHTNAKETYSGFLHEHASTKTPDTLQTLSMPVLAANMRQD